MSGNKYIAKHPRQNTAKLSPVAREYNRNAHNFFLRNCPDHAISIRMPIHAQGRGRDHGRKAREGAWLGHIHV